MQLWTVRCHLWNNAITIDKGAPVEPRPDLWKGLVPAICLGEKAYEVVIKVNPKLLVWKDHGYRVERGELKEDGSENFLLEPEEDQSSEALIIFTVRGEKASSSLRLARGCIGWKCIPKLVKSCPDSQTICDLPRPKGPCRNCGSSEWQITTNEWVPYVLIGLTYYYRRRAWVSNPIRMSAVVKLNAHEPVFIIPNGVLQQEDVKWTELLYDGNELIATVYNNDGFPQPTKVIVAK